MDGGSPGWSLASYGQDSSNKFNKCCLCNSELLPRVSCSENTAQKTETKEVSHRLVISGDLQTSCLDASPKMSVAGSPGLSLLLL